MICLLAGVVRLRMGARVRGPKPLLYLARLISAAPDLSLQFQPPETTILTRKTVNQRERLSPRNKRSKYSRTFSRQVKSRLRKAKPSTQTHDLREPLHHRRAFRKPPNHRLRGLPPRPRLLQEANPWSSARESLQRRHLSKLRKI